MSHGISVGMLQGIGGLLLTGLTIVGGWIIAWFVDRGQGPGQPTMTRLDWIVITFGSALALMALLWGALLIAPRLIALWRELRPAVKPASDNGAPAAVGRKPSATSHVEFVVEGAWLNTPFHFSTHGANETGDAVFAEDAYLTITASDFLESVRVQMIVSSSDNRHVHEYWHKGVFEGAVTPGMTERIRFFRRTFWFEKVGSTSVRREGEIILFDGTPEEVKGYPCGLSSIKVYVHHKRGKERGRLVIDSDVVPAPRSRLVVGDRVKLVIGNNYVRPFGAAMVYEDIAHEAQEKSKGIHP